MVNLVISHRWPMSPDASAEALFDPCSTWLPAAAGCLAHGPRERAQGRQGGSTPVAMIWPNSSQGALKVNEDLLAAIRA
jgi:hypothetical protein